MTNDNSKKIMDNVNKNNWIFLVILYHFIYAYVVNQSQGSYLDAHRLNITLEVQAKLNMYTYHFYVMELLFISFVSAWHFKSKIAAYISLGLVVGLYLLLPEMWVFQIAFVPVIILMIVKIPRKLIGSQQ